MSKTSNQNPFGQLLYLIACVCTAMIGHTIHNSLFLAIIDFLFTPLAWIKWLICHEVTLEIIKKSFNWFFCLKHLQ